MVYWDEQGNTVEISKADQLWLDDGYFKTQQAHLPPDAPRAALSYRVSTKGQVDHNDIPMQKIKCRKFAQQQGWRVVMEKAEKGISGSKVSASKRDVIQELRQEAGNGSFDILLVYMFDRLGRIESETPFVLEWFVQHGIQMWSVHEGQQRIESHGDKLMNYIRFWQAAGESEKTSIRTRDRIRQIVSSGHFAGGFVPYGYRAVDKGRVNKRDQPVKDLEIDPEEAAWVREVFEKVANEGASGYAMARMLNDRGLCTRQGARFQSVNIRRMIRHEGYTGYLITKAARSEFIQELQIVDEKLFARANEVIDCRSKKLAQEKNIAAKTNNPTLLAGIVVCAHCGAKMSAFLHTDRYKLADGTIREKVQAKYNCYQRGQKLRACDGQSLYLAERVDAVVLEVVHDIFRRIQQEPYDRSIEQKLRQENGERERQKQAAEKKIKAAQYIWNWASRPEASRHKEGDIFCENRQGFCRSSGTGAAAGRIAGGKQVFDSPPADRAFLFVDAGFYAACPRNIRRAAARGAALHAGAQYHHPVRRYQQELDDAKAEYAELQNARLNEAAEIRKLRTYYDDFKGWAEEFDTAPLEMKRMILSHLIDRVEVGRKYQVIVKFNMKYRQFLECTAETYNTEIGA